MLIKSVLEKKIKQGLPVVDFKQNDIALSLINEVLIQKDFLESNIWNSKRIVADFNNVEIRSKQISQIWRIVRTHLMTKGFLQRKEKVTIAHQKIEENFNRLN